MPEHRNFKARILCDGELLEEYKGAQDAEDERVYTCWVASEAGKASQILQDREDVTLSTLITHGVETHSYVDLASTNKGGASSGVKSGPGELRPYVFSNVLLTDDEAYFGVENTTDTSKLGNITLQIYLVHAHTKILPRRKPRRFHTKVVDLYDGAVHESTKKFCDHRITLGDAIPFGPPGHRPSSRKLTWKPVDRNDTRPHAIFQFKYRPLAYLQAQGIAPLPPFEPTPQRPIRIEVDLVEQNKDKGNGVYRGTKRPLADQSSSERNTTTGCAASHMPLFLPSSSEQPYEQYIGLESILPVPHMTMPASTPNVKIKQTEVRI
ncbi:hypothetical protein EW145_g1963 [Phellinidium pouzarii]|uniref:DUF7918 domain-containing protein n=1 Tax=Phellinidium pouzarii TaxID=167371 RepID=A0A4S4LE97_9AGAM|nr:hypothetical protein EW145_g1963 [Phellinidium pouzarii]